MCSASGQLLARRYRLDARIATGGFGEVWRATDVLLARPVAIKLLQAAYIQHPETLGRFQAEARNAAAVSHENIAHVYDYGEPDSEHPPFLVMELIDGPPLAEVLAGGPMEPARAMDIVAQAARGLHVAHLAGLVHRDIKPGNLLLSGSGLVKITDFGIAYAAGSAPITGTGMVMGTPSYLAPERVRGSSASTASDLYALGIVAYECLAGTPPFTGMPVEVAIAHRDAPLPPLPASVPVGVAALVADLTAKDPGARPASAAEVASRAARLRDHLLYGGLAQVTPASPLASRPGGLRSGGVRSGGVRSAGIRSGGVRSAAVRSAAVRWWRGRPWDARSGAAGSMGARWWRSWPARIAAAAVTAAACVIGLALASGPGAAPPRHPAAASSSAPARSAPAVQLVSVNGDALVGQPVSAAVSRLKRLGLDVRVAWRASSQQPPGMVLSVSPEGQLPAGHLVTVTGALRPAATSPVLQVSRQPRGDGHGSGRPRHHREHHGHGQPPGHGRRHGHGKPPGHGRRHGRGRLLGPGPRSAGQPA